MRLVPTWGPTKTFFPLKKQQFTTLYSLFLSQRDSTKTFLLYPIVTQKFLLHLYKKHKKFILFSPFLTNILDNFLKTAPNTPMSQNFLL